MTAYKGEIWIANLNPVKKNNEVGKIRPVLIFQSNDLNESNYPTVITIPLTTSLINDAEPIRMRIEKRELLKEDSDLLIAQIRAIDKSRLIERVASLTEKELQTVQEFFNEILE